MKNNLWTKKLDVMHKYESSAPGMTGTICGKPMLGNNYVELFPDRERCKACFPGVHNKEVKE